MRIVLQRVAAGSVAAEGGREASIEAGLVALVGFCEGDDMTVCEQMSKKMSELRIFEDENGQMNRSLLETGGECLIVPNFTLYASCRKGRRPSFTGSMEPKQASRLFTFFCGSVAERGVKTETGTFGAHMRVNIAGDGPVTIILDSDEIMPSKPSLDKNLSEKIQIEPPAHAVQRNNTSDKSDKTGGNEMNVTIIPVGKLGTNCYLLASKEGGCAVIDPGAQPAKIADIIEEKGYKPRYILITHGHPDHIGGTRELMDKYPDVKVYIGEKDRVALVDQQQNSTMMRSFGGPDCLVPESIPLHDGDALTLDDLEIKVMETPGHSRGGVCYLCGNLLFAGDTLFRDDIGRCDFPGGDFAVMKQTLSRLAALEGDYEVYPGHGESTTLSYERANNIYINR